MIPQIAVPLFANDELFGSDLEQEVSDESSNYKIVGGKSTTIQQHPYQLSIRRSNRHFCGGVLLTTTKALTAATCIQLKSEPSLFIIMAGSTLRLGDANATLRLLSRYIHHPQFHPHRVTYNIALLIWEHPLTFGPNIRPIKLPRQSAQIPYKKSAIVTGWGLIREGPGDWYAPRLQVVRKPLMSNLVCNRAYFGLVTADMLCAGGPQGGESACLGDTGGPLTRNGVLIGLVSWARGCARPEYPYVYTRVPFFIDWIQANINA